MYHCHLEIFTDAPSLEKALSNLIDRNDKFILDDYRQSPCLALSKL